MQELTRKAQYIKQFKQANLSTVIHNYKLSQYNRTYMHFLHITEEVVNNLHTVYGHCISSSYVLPLILSYMPLLHTIQMSSF